MLSKLIEVSFKKVSHIYKIYLDSFLVESMLLFPIVLNFNSSNFFYFLFGFKFSPLFSFTTQYSKIKMMTYISVAAPIKSDTSCKAFILSSLDNYII